VRSIWGGYRLGSSATVRCVSVPYSCPLANRDHYSRQAAAADLPACTELTAVARPQWLS
jgi:hypothetical protein